jgi:hypothetical protein
MPSGDSRCKFCGEPIRWVDDDGRRLALDIVPIPEGSYRVVGAETARRIKKADRANFAKLYRPHKETCAKAEDAKAFFERQRADRLAQQNRTTFPPNVVPYRNPSIIPPRRRR